MNTQSLISDALNHIPASIEREEWVKIGLALKSANMSFSVFHDWSKGAINYKSKTDCQTVWKQKPKQVTPAYILKNLPVFVPLTKDGHEK